MTIPIVTVPVLSSVIQLSPLRGSKRSCGGRPAHFGAARWNCRCGGSRIDPQLLIYDYCETSLQAVHDYVTPVSGRSSGLFPRLRYEGSVRLLACALGGTHSVCCPAGA